MDNKICVKCRKCKVMVLAFNTGNVADTGKPGLTSPQARVTSSGDSEVAKVSSAVSQNVETRRVETRRPVEASAESQKPRPLPSQLQAELNKSRDISFSDKKTEISSQELAQKLDQKQAAERKAIAKAEQKSPAQADSQAQVEKRAQAEAQQERRAQREERPPENKSDDQSFVRLEAQRAYFDRLDAQRAYRKATEREVQVRGERSRAA